MAISDLPLTFIAGLALILLGTLMTTVSVQLRISATSAKGIKDLKAQCKYDDEEYTKTSNRRQLIGWGLYMEGMSCGQLSLSLVPATVAACTTFSMALVWNGLLAPFLLKDKFTSNHFVGLVLLVVGCCVALANASHESQDYDWPRMRDFVEQPISFAPVIAGLGVILVIVIESKIRGSKINSFSFAFVYSFIGALDLLAQKWLFQIGRVYASCSGLVGGTSDQSALDGPSDSCNPPWWVSGVSIALLGVLHALVLATENMATTFGDTLSNRPLFLAADAVFQVLLCGAFFQEFSTFTEMQYLYFGLGFLVMLFGVIVTIHAHPKEEEELTEPLVPDEQPPLSHSKTAPIGRPFYRRCPLSSLHNHTIRGSIRRANTTMSGHFSEQCSKKAAAGGAAAAEFSRVRSSTEPGLS